MKPQRNFFRVSILDKLKRLFGSTPPTVEDPVLKRVFHLIETDDGRETEMAKDSVTKDQLPQIASHYKTLKDWDQKAVAIYMVDFHRDPVLQPMALDFLRAPLVEGSNNHDHRFFAKVSALMLLDEKYEKVAGNYQAGKQAVAEYIKTHNIQVEPSGD